MRASAATWSPSPLTSGIATYVMVTGTSRRLPHSSPGSRTDARTLRMEGTHDAARTLGHHLFPQEPGCRERRQQEHYRQLQLHVQIPVSIRQRSTRDNPFGTLPRRSRRTGHPGFSGASGTRVRQHTADEEPTADRHPLVHEVRRVRGALGAGSGPSGPGAVEQTDPGTTCQPSDPGGNDGGSSMPRIPVRATESVTRRCSILASPPACVPRNWWVSVSTTLNSTVHIPASSCMERLGGNAASRCGRKRRGPCEPGWPYAVLFRPPRSS